MKHANNLIHSTSPYLLQHAYNPIAWHEWSHEALALARSLNKPILISIGYSSCHWCHVMERECFEDEAVARLMNDNYVCIKVDREERPDIDQIYMEAVQAMGIGGGWPLNVFLTPDQKPFYGGTYFPKHKWMQLLTQIHAAFVNKRIEIDDSAEELTRHISTSDVARFVSKDEHDFEATALDTMYQKLAGKFDNVWGGVDKAPKFVMPSLWLFLLRYFAFSKDDKALGMTTLTLDKISAGGLYDQVAGGFSRYSVDAQWFAPHFEKMLYDNAQLISLYSEAYQLTGEKRYKAIVYDTLEWLNREMTHPRGGFFSALDADSEGVEGKFYTWTYDELHTLLGQDAAAFCNYYQVTPEGNWEHGRNILIFDDTTRGAMTPAALSAAHNKLLAEREKRVRPGLDDKILAGWNCMTITALADAYKAFTDDRFLLIAERAMTFVQQNMVTDGKLCRAYKDKVNRTEGFLEDYAYFIQALTKLYEVTFKIEYLKEAEHWTQYVFDNFYDPREAFFFFTANGAETLIARKKETFDNVIPSSNSVMASNLLHLGTLLSNIAWQEKARTMVSQLYNLITKEPNYMSNWGIVLLEMIAGLYEVVIMGDDAHDVRKELQRHYLPFTVTAGGTAPEEPPLLQNRFPNHGTLIYVCQHQQCKLPVNTVTEALQQLT